MDAAVVLAIIELLLRVGPKAFLELVKKLDVDEPTVEQIKALKVKSPEEYLND